MWYLLQKAFVIQLKEDYFVIDLIGIAEIDGVEVVGAQTIPNLVEMVVIMVRFCQF